MKKPKENINTSWRYNNRSNKGRIIAADLKDDDRKDSIMRKHSWTGSYDEEDTKRNSSQNMSGRKKKKNEKNSYGGEMSRRPKKRIYFYNRGQKCRNIVCTNIARAKGYCMRCYTDRRNDDGSQSSRT